MKHLLSILILISFISTSNAGIFDVFKGDETYCFDKIIDNGGNTQVAVAVCVNPTPSKTCMRRVQKEIIEKNSEAWRKGWIKAAEICQNKPR